jgi:hypothetical protein
MPLRVKQGYLVEGDFFHGVLTRLKFDDAGELVAVWARRGVVGIGMKV